MSFCASSLALFQSLSVADDFGYVMPGQRQKRVSERR